MKHLLGCALVGALLCTPAFAQPQQQRGNGNNNFGAQGGAVFQLPPSVQNVVSIDALNMIIIASDGEREGETVYTPSIIQHVYSGGIARLFGGTAVPTAQFVTPGLMNGGGNNGNGNNGVSNANNNAFGGQNNGGNANGFGNNGGFNNGGFGGFNNGATFQNGVLSGNGFNTQNQNITANAQARARVRTR